MKRLFIILFFFPALASAQLVNTGEKLFIDNGGIIYVQDDFIHTSGSALNNGKLIIEGDTKNKDIASRIFDTRSAGLVILNGASQKVTGKPVLFPALELKGSGIKYLETNAEISSFLNLNDRELIINSNILSVTNSSATAIQRSSGYINTDLGGKLIRNALMNTKYLYPLGSSAANRYRPVSVEPKDANGLFALTLYNGDPNLKGYNRSTKRVDVKNVYDKYWYILDEISGGIITDVSFMVNSADGSGSQLVEWSKFNLWEKAAPSLQKSANFGDGLNSSYLYTSSSKIRDKPFTFADAENAMPGPLTFFNGFSPDGDGKNDTWTIKNIELFPDNDLTIINRWGDEVFRTKGYSNSKAWNGGDLNAGTYYYILNVNINGERKSYKGFITMVKN